MRVGAVNRLCLPVPNLRLFVLLRLFQVQTHFWGKEPWRRFWTAPSPQVPSACTPLVPCECRLLLPLLPKGAHLSALRVQLWKLNACVLSTAEASEKHNWKQSFPHEHFLCNLFWSFLKKYPFLASSFVVCLFWHRQFQTEGSSFITGSLGNFSTNFTMPFSRCTFPKGYFSPYRWVGTSLQ